MSRLVPAQQGKPDGLCGIYSLLNFMRNLSDFAPGNRTEKVVTENDQECLRYLLEAAWGLNILLPRNITHGFEQHQLKLIFNKISADFDLQFKAELLERAASSYHTDDVFKVVSKIVGAGGAAVVHLAKFDHWVLVYGLDGASLLIDDSFVWEDKEGVRSYSVDKKDRTRLGLASLSGLAIIAQPAASPIATSGL